MKKSFWLWSLALMVLVVSLAACGSDDSPAAPTLSGTASAGAAMPAGSVINVKGANGVSVTTLVLANGAYTVDVSTLTPPYIVKAESLSNVFYALASAAGRVNVNPFTNLAAFNAAPGNDPAALYTGFTTLANAALTQSYGDQVAAIVTKFANAVNGITVTNAFQSGDITIGQGVDAIFDHIDIAVSGNTVTMTNSDSGQTIGSYSGNNMAGMTLTNLPTITVIVTPASCDVGYVGQTTNITFGAVTCNSVTVCAKSQLDIYYVVGGTRINLDYARMQTDTAYALNFATQVSQACPAQ